MIHAWQGFLTGMSMTAVCAATCAPVLLASLLVSGSALRPVASFLAGRFVAYMTFAFLAGTVSVYFEGRLHPDLFALLTMLLALWLILASFGKLPSSTWFCRMTNASLSEIQLPFLAGFVMGLNPCPPFLLGLDQVLQMHAIGSAVIFFTGFYFGSSIWVLGLLFTGRHLQHRYVRLIGRIASLGAGAYFLWQGARVFLR